MWEKEKLLVTSNFSFSHNVFHNYISLLRQNVALCGNGLRENLVLFQIFYLIFYFILLYRAGWSISKKIKSNLSIWSLGTICMIIFVKPACSKLDMVDTTSLRCMCVHLCVCVCVCFFTFFHNVFLASQNKFQFFINTYYVYQSKILPLFKI